MERKVIILTYNSYSISPLIASLIALSLTLILDDKQELQSKKEALQLLEKKPASADQLQTNGDTKIKIMEPEKTFSGMTKDELMKYANDPFWIRLRWFMFILFWAVWLGMLVGALFIIVYAPKCAPTEKLSWWQTGPLLTVDSTQLPDAAILNSIQATGIVYKVPADDTYNAERMSAHKKAIEEVLAMSNNKAAKVIVDLVPNYVPAKDDMFMKALVDKNQRDAFVWVDRAQTPNNWKAINGGTAWTKQEDSSFVLSQFAENRFDLQMNHAANKERLKKVILDYGKLAGVCGFRLANAKNYIVNTQLADEEDAKRNGNYGHEDYQFWTHTQTTFVAGLTDLLAELKATALNATADHCEGTFFGSSNSAEFTDLYAQSNGQLTLESVPVKLNLYQSGGGKGKNSEAIVRELRSLSQLTDKGIYAEHQYSEASKEAHLLSEQYLFTFLLPGGVPAITEEQLAEDANQKEPSLKLANLLALRNSPSFTQGSFKVYQDTEKQMVGYTRVKAGSPGYLVVYNPTGTTFMANFNTTGIETDLTLAVVSQNYKEEGITLK